MRFCDIQDFLNKSKVYSYNTISNALKTLVSLHLMTCNNKRYQVQEEKNFRGGFIKIDFDYLEKFFSGQVDPNALKLLLIMIKRKQFGQCLSINEITRDLWWNSVSNTKKYIKLLKIGGIIDYDTLCNFKHYYFL